MLFIAMCIQCVGQVYTVCIPLETNPGNAEDNGPIL